MPRFVRPFWLEADIDGRAHMIEAGPRRKDGGIHLTIRQRDEGRISPKALTIIGSVDEEGAITLRVFDGEVEVYRKESVV